MEWSYFMMYKIFLISFLLVLISCQKEEKSKRLFIGIKLKPLYEREMKAWSSSVVGETYEVSPPTAPAKIYFNNKWYQGSLKIRGDLSSHWKDDKRSYRVALKDSSLLGLQEFDLIIPSDKSYELEAVAYEWAQKLGIPSPQYQFVDVQINHKIFSRYLLVERWTKSSFERRNIPNGAIIGEHNAWIDSVQMGEKSLYKNVFQKQGIENPIAQYPHIYRANENDLNSQLALSKFFQLLGSKSIEDYIDIEKTTKWLALVSYLGAEHAILGDNTRWIYDGHIQKFYPVVYDVLGVTTKLSDNKCLLDHLSQKNTLISRLYRTPKFQERFKYWLSWLIHSPEIDFDKEWKTVADKFWLADWDKGSSQERSEIQTVVRSNINLVKKIESHGFCQI